MKKSDFTTSFTVNQSPEEVFKAVNNVRGWWSASLKGNSTKLNDEFTYVYRDMHTSKQRLVEIVPNKKVVWLVSDSRLTFVNKKNEWDGTRISFDISSKEGKTELVFTHYGLIPSNECFEACSGGWMHYINQSLLPLITEGQGNPD